MKFSKAGITALSAGTAVALMVASAGTASAAPLGKPKHPKPRHHAVTQVTGTKLATALLPASAFGNGHTASDKFSTGRSLWSTRITGRWPQVKCSGLGDVIPGFGETAMAADLTTAPSSASTASTLVGTQSISQFASGKTASWFSGQYQAKYSSCQSFSETLPGGQDGNLTLTINLEKVTQTTVAKFVAFTVAQSAEVSDGSGTDVTFYMETTVVNAGDDVYAIEEINTADTAVPGSMLSTLIKRSQALYH